MAEHGPGHEMKYAYLYHRASARRHFNTTIKMKKVFNANETANLNGWHTNTDLGCDLKTLLRSDKRAKAGKSYSGILKLDSEAIVDEFLCRDAHYTFIETVRMTADRRNPHVFYGKYITITRRPDGTLRPNFKPMPAGMSVDNYAFEVYRELRGALKGLVEK